MSATIKQTLSLLPETPGIYRMLSANEEVLYIGKAKNLVKRVTYYTKPGLPERLRLMTSLTHKLEHVVTKSEAEALLLEARLIKKQQPRFNILLKDDKSFPYITFRLDHPFPQILKYRGKTPPAGLYFGAFASNFDVETTLKELQKIFKLRTCSDNYFDSRIRPCLQYQIKRCTAPCTGKINQEDYSKLVSQATDFLSGKSKRLQAELSREMDHYSENMEYEKAAEVRDRIKALSYIQLKFGDAQNIVGNADVIRLETSHGAYAISIGRYRLGQYYGNKVYFPVHTEEASKAEVMEAFVMQFYQDKICPEEIILSCEINNKEEIEKLLRYNLSLSDIPINWDHPLKEGLDKAMPKNNTNKTKITIPARGGKFQLLQSFEESTRQALETHLKSQIKQQQVMKDIQSLFNLPDTLARIEVYDNSHISGQYAVGAMVVAGPEGFMRREYRYYNVLSTSLTGGDDYAMLRQVMIRRLEKIAKRGGVAPDLMIIDGGKGHMSTVLAVMEKTGIKVPFVCMAKGEDRNAGKEYFHIPGQEAFTIPSTDKVMRYLQVLRDEAHNYAIKQHRAKRTRAMRTSALDQIEGVGARRKRDLLNQFGSIDYIKSASEEELASIASIGKSTARKIFAALHKDV